MDRNFDTETLMDNRQYDLADTMIHDKKYLYELQFTLVFATKNQLELFNTPTKRANLNKILRLVAANNQIVVTQSKVTATYVILNIEIKPSKSIADVLKALKGRSAYLFLQKHPQTNRHADYDGHLWANSYLVTTNQLNDAQLNHFLNDSRYNGK